MNSISKHSAWFKWISDPDIYKFIAQHADRETSSLALELTQYPAEKRNFILNQISSHQSAQKKIPEYSSFSEVIYPPNQSLEQSSSELTAKYKSSLFRGKTFLDLTAGFGVDSFYFSKVFDSIELVEKSDILLDLLRHNFGVLKVNGVNFHCDDALNFLKKLNQKVDLIYLDPSRRKGDKRLLDIRDYDPNIVELSSQLKEKARHVLIKLSPISDLQQIISLIPNLSSLTVLSVKNECKEILVTISEESSFNHDIAVIDLSEKSNREFTFNLLDENDIKLSYSDVKNYLYLPMTAAVKAGAFKSISRDFGVEKLSGNTHIYTSSELKGNFPGRAFECFETIAFNKNLFKKHFTNKGFNVQCRNFPLKPEQVAKKLRILDHGELHLIAFRNRFEKLQISIAKPINV